MTTLKKYKLDGKTVYRFVGYDYGCCSDEEIPVTEEPMKYPFLGVLQEHLIPDGTITVDVDTYSFK